MAELIPPPEEIFYPLKYKEKTLLGPGPSNCYPSVLQAMCRQPYAKVMADVRSGLKYLFQTKNEMTFCISGTGTSGMEATFMNLLEPGDKVLSLQSGFWGARAADMVSRLSKQHICEIIVKLWNLNTQKFQLISPDVLKIRSHYNAINIALLQCISLQMVYL